MFTVTKILSLTCLLAALTQVSKAQNLVPNPSFEEYYECPQWIGDFTVTDWVKPTWGSSDYFHTCSTGQLGIPQNEVGWQEANMGNAYAGIWLSDFGENEYREYIQCQLLSPLESGEKYSVSFYVSLADSATKACDNIGALLSVTPVSLNDNINIPFTPQIISESNNPITDTFNWVLVTDTIIAEGGEEYLTIGVFTNNENTHWVTVNGGWISEAYYYIDDVSVVKTSPNSIYNIDKGEFSIFPNPTCGIVTITSGKEIESYEVYSLSGQMIISNVVNSRNTLIDMSMSPDGLYVVRILTNEFTAVKKIIVNHHKNQKQ